MNRIPLSFFEADALTLAPALLGKILVRRTAAGLMRARIVETEAYRGTCDRAAHAFRGRTPRTEVLFAPGGRAYVYLIYGLYCCLNLTVNADPEKPECVLIRAAQPLEGLEQMAARRRGAAPTALCAGPGRLCMALDIDRSLNGRSLDGDDLWLEEDGFSPERIAVSPRIGVDYAGEDREKPWRFFLPDDPFVSRPPRRRA